MTLDERALLDMIYSGILRIDEAGLIWRCKKKHKEYEGYRRCTPRLIGHDNHGYIRISLLDVDGKTIHGQVHRLVFMYHYGDIPEGLQINHKNGIKHDNRLDNLELMTSSQQMIHAVNVLGRKVGNRKTGHRFWKVAEKEFSVIKKSNLPIKELAEKYDVTTARIYQIRKEG